MITVKLLGGLGNQMFQRAYGIALQARGFDVEYNKTALVPGTHREYSLDGFRGSVKTSELIFPNNVYEDGMRFKPEMLNPQDGSTMVGYWQSEKYFEGIEQQVRRAFVSRTPLSSPAYETLQEIKASNSAFLHIRRQDYVNLQHFHGLPSIHYYLDAARHIEDLSKAPLSLFVFTDDPAWAEKYFSGLVVKGLTKFEDLELMSWCKHAITANSSFSWWGAWLRENPGFTVAPKQWFADPKVDFSDVVPERWIKL